MQTSNFEKQMEPPPMATNYPLQNVFGSAFAVSFMSWLLKTRFKESKEFQYTQFLLSKLAGKEGCLMILVIHSVFLQLCFLVTGKNFLNVCTRGRSTKIEDELGDQNSRTPPPPPANARDDYQKPGHLILTM
jgi:hypothetical protein